MTAKPPRAEHLAYDAVLAAPFARIGLQVRDGFLERLEFLDHSVPLLAPSVPLTRGVWVQLQAYLCDPGFRFSIPVRAAGTPFQRRVWKALTAIPGGSVRSYGELAQLLGTSARAVGGACRANPVPLIVPCHRVVAAAALGGFAGCTEGPSLAHKRWLLAHEGADGGFVRRAALKSGRGIPM